MALEPGRSLATPALQEASGCTLAAVLATDADWSALAATTPAKVRDLLQRCLEKDPSAFRRWALGATLLGGLIAGVLLATFIARRAPTTAGTGVVRLDLEFPPDVRFDNFVVSPNGSAIAAVGCPNADLLGWIAQAGFQRARAQRLHQRHAAGRPSARQHPRRGRVR